MCRLSLPLFVLLLLFISLSYSAPIDLILGIRSLDGKAEGEVVQVPATLTNNQNCELDCVYTYENSGGSTEIGKAIRPSYTMEFIVNLKIPRCLGAEGCQFPIKADCQAHVPGTCPDTSYSAVKEIRITNVGQNVGTGGNTPFEPVNPLEPVSPLQPQQGCHCEDNRNCESFECKSCLDCGGSGSCYCEDNGVCETGKGECPECKDCAGGQRTFSADTFRVDLSEKNISGLAEDSRQTVKATLFNQGKCALACKYKIPGTEDQYQTITEGINPGSSSAFNIIFFVPVECREPCSISAHVICMDKQSNECPNPATHETDVSFDLYDIKPVDKTIGYIVLALLSAGTIYILFNVVKFLKKKFGTEKEPAPEQGTRKLSAIMFTDMKGFSREMGTDEEATLKKLWRYEKAMKAIIKEHGGRVVKTIGDAIMGDFDSAVQSVRAAMAIQDLLKKEDIKIRIGIHLGDVIHKAGDVFGDGVNIASRIESICEPGEIYISEDVYNQVRGKIKGNFESLGRKPLKNIDVPPRVYRIRG